MKTEYSGKYLLNLKIDLNKLSITAYHVGKSVREMLLARIIRITSSVRSRKIRCMFRCYFRENKTKSIKKEGRENNNGSNLGRKKRKGRND